jgi:uncharacterized protein (TIGR02145 family)
MSRFNSSLIAKLIAAAAFSALGLVLVSCMYDDDHIKINEDSFIDSRDGKTYRTVEIFEDTARTVKIEDTAKSNKKQRQTWMAENLNYKTSSNSWCYEDDSANCEKYGRLYTWDEAIKACPAGWKLPTSEDWDTLITAAGGLLAAGAKLKAGSPGWDGTDSLSFSALPGGYRATDGAFYRLGEIGRWWTYSDPSHINMYKNRTYVFKYSYAGSVGFSVRCLKEDYD